MGGCEINKARVAKLADAPDLGLRNHRFQSVALRFTTRPLYNGKTPALAKLRHSTHDELKGHHSSTNSSTRTRQIRQATNLPIDVEYGYKGDSPSLPVKRNHLPSRDITSQTHWRTEPRPLPKINNRASSLADRIARSSPVSPGKNEAFCSEKLNREAYADFGITIVFPSHLTRNVLISVSIRPVPSTPRAQDPSTHVLPPLTVILCCAATNSVAPIATSRLLRPSRDVALKWRVSSPAALATTLKHTEPYQSSKADVKREREREKNCIIAQ
jgi:hypothetical protein